MSAVERTDRLVSDRRAADVENTLLFDDDDVIDLLEAAIEREGSQTAFAKRHGIDRADLNAVLNGRRRVNATVVKALRLRKMYVAD